MGYEYKDYIRDEILSNINHCNIFDDALDELDHVYTQAPKADEYEAKAKAFDRIVEQRKKTGVRTLGHYAWEIIREYESGEYDAKK